MGDSIRKSACEPCYCGHNGHINCAIVDCFFTLCVDSVHDPDHCCPQCPNGSNCMGPNNTIIKKGETYQPDPLTTCECPQNQFGFHANKAICAQSLVTDAPLVVS
ncbi:VWC2-like protein [Mya arenaria]|uniref:VWC2-like protein n=2 Tax=Mya arenaria TaxID=6604 RepID=A0ABY7DTU9_MYAAR|nr:VWC2-like protein [Mya arenaria]